MFLFIWHYIIPLWIGIGFLSFFLFWWIYEQLAPSLQRTPVPKSERRRLREYTFRDLVRHLGITIAGPLAFIVLFVILILGLIIEVREWFEANESIVERILNSQVIPTRRVHTDRDK